MLPVSTLWNMLTVIRLVWREKCEVWVYLRIHMLDLNSPRNSPWCLTQSYKSEVWDFTLQRISSVLCDSIALSLVPCWATVRPLRGFGSPFSILGDLMVEDKESPQYTQRTCQNRIALKLYPQPWARALPGTDFHEARTRPCGFLYPD